MDSKRFLTPSASLQKPPAKKLHREESRPPSQSRMKIQTLLQARLKNHFEVAPGQSLKRSDIQSTLTTSFTNVSQENDATSKFYDK